MRHRSSRLLGFGSKFRLPSRGHQYVAAGASLQESRDKHRPRFQELHTTTGMTDCVRICMPSSGQARPAHEMTLLDDKIVDHDHPGTSLEGQAEGAKLHKQEPRSSLLEVRMALVQGYIRMQHPHNCLATEGSTCDIALILQRGFFRKSSAATFKRIAQDTFSVSASIRWTKVLRSNSTRPQLLFWCTLLLFDSSRPASALATWQRNYTQQGSFRQRGWVSEVASRDNSDPLDQLLDSLGQLQRLVADHLAEVSAYELALAMWQSICLRQQAQSSRPAAQIRPGQVPALGFKGK